MKEHVTLTLIGSINTGKSSIINALLGKEIVTTSAKGGETINSSEFDISQDYWFSNSSYDLKITDTPGISEANGQVRQDIAVKTAINSDLILFTIGSDINEVEFSTLKQIHEQHKPIIVLFNQIDKYNSKQRAEIESSLTKRLKGYVEPHDILSISSAPIKQILIVNKDGDEELTERSDIPNVNLLQKRIIDILNKEGKHLKELNSYLSEYNKKKIERDEKIKAIKDKVPGIVEEYSVITAIAIGANPVPLLDIAGGGASIVMLIKKLATIYDIELEENEITKLSTILWDEGKELLAGVIVTNVIGSALKSIPFIGTVVGGVIQGGPAGYFVYVLGLSTAEYLENGKKWKDNRSLKDSLEEIISSVDKSAITAKITQRIKQKLT